jgi:undecaprenyl-diphosphatase
MRLPVFMLLLASALPAATAPEPENTAYQPTLRDSVVLGLVEGITEFLPVSSTGHLIIANSALGLDSDRPVAVDENGAVVTLKEAADTYAVVIQAGAILAVALLYWSKLLSILAGLRGRDPAGLRLLRNLVLACVPPVVAALAFKDFIKGQLFSVQTVAWALLFGAGLMIFAERWRLRKQTRAQTAALPDSPDLLPADLTIGRSLAIGAIQCLALWPGMSRSMTAMVAGYFVGMRPVRAAEFSFLLGLPLLGAAAAKDALDGGPAVIAAFGWSHVLVGLAVSFVSAALAVRLFVGFLTRHGLLPFAIYRILLGVGLLWFIAK